MIHASHDPQAKETVLLHWEFLFLAFQSLQARPDLYKKWLVGHIHPLRNCCIDHELLLESQESLLSFYTNWVQLVKALELYDLASGDQVYPS